MRHIMRSAGIVFGFLLLAAAAAAQQYVISTYAGGAPTPTEGGFHLHQCRIRKGAQARRSPATSSQKQSTGVTEYQKRRNLAQISDQFCRRHLRRPENLLQTCVLEFTAFVWCRPVQREVKRHGRQKKTEFCRFCTPRMDLPTANGLLQIRNRHAGDNIGEPPKLHAPVAGPPIGLLAKHRRSRPSGGIRQPKHVSDSEREFYAP